MNSMKWLMKREFWEHKGGFFWAPIVAGGIFALLNIMAIAVSSAAADRNHIKIGLVKLDGVIKSMPPEALEGVAAGIDLTLMMITSMIGVVTAVVVFFYCLGALYDDRRDRSVLFWKSLPISDRDTVASKVLSALVVAPVIGMLAGMATALVTLLMVGIFFAFHGQNFFGILFLNASPVRALLLMLASLPVAALWALPSIGWLMLCSAWARSKPFLWAVGIPVGLGIAVSWFDLMKSVSVPDYWFWQHIVARALFSMFPGTWFGGSLDQLENIESPAELAELVNLGTVYASLASPHLWVGALVGAAMLFAAVRLRRWRDEG
jgi:ABC-2 type transport system permease protein